MKTKIILILVTLSLFACKKEYYTYEQFRITNGTQHELVASFDGKEHIIQPSEEVTIDIARQDYEYTGASPVSFPNIVSKLSIFRIINNEKVYLAREKYDSSKWGLYSRNVTEEDREVGYTITITEDMFVLE